MRIFLRPRWIAGHLLVLAVVVSFVNLGLWQLRRLAEVRAHNALVSERLDAPALPLPVLLARTGDDPDALAFRRVRLRGTYAAEDQMLTLPRSRDGRPAQQVLTVLRSPGSPAVLADRGTVGFSRDLVPSDVPPPAGTVEVEGVLLPPEAGSPGQTEQVRRIAPDALEQRVGTALLSSPLLVTEQRPATGALRLGELPALDEGSHFPYAVQWFLFAVVTLVGYPVLLRKTLREHRGPVEPPQEELVSGGSPGTRAG